MAFAEKRLAGPVAITNSNQTTVYTCPTAQTTTTMVKQIILTNTSASSARAITLNLVPSGGSVQTSNRILSSISVPANESMIFDMSQVMTSGDILSIITDGGAGSDVNVTISGIESAGGMVISGLADNAVTTAKIADSNVTAAKLGPDAFIANNQAGAIVLMEMM